MIDSHCHLDHEPLYSDLNNVIKRSKDIGIKKLLTISTSLESFSIVTDIVKKHDIIFGTIGIHPHEVDKNEIDKEFDYSKGRVGLARTQKYNTEDSQFFIILQDEPLYEGEFTPIGKVIYGIKVLEKIKYLDKSEYVLRPDFINSLRLLIN